MNESLEIMAFDEAGNTFKKQVRLEMGSSFIRVSMGFPIEYNLEQLLLTLFTATNRHRFYIDAAGRNHKGSPVYVHRQSFIIIIAGLVRNNADG